MKNSEGCPQRPIYIDRVKDGACAPYAEHSHPDIEIYFLYDGECAFTVLDKEYKLEGGSLIFIPRDTPHSAEYCSGTHSRCVINLDPSGLREPLAEALAESGVITLRGVGELIEPILDKICREYESGDRFSDAAISILLDGLALMLLRAEGACEDVTEEEGIVKRAVAYIHSNYSTEVRLSGVARLLSVSREHLSRSFKREMGCGFNEYLTLYRLKKANEMLLREPARPISEVAYASGFSDGNYFSHKYRQVYGYPPTEARKRARNGE